MKKILVALLMLVFLAVAVPQAKAQNKMLKEGRVIFLCGDSSQKIIDEMMPLLPAITKDNFGFIYLNYNIGGVMFIFQFYNDKLGGILIGIYKQGQKL